MELDERLESVRVTARGARIGPDTTLTDCIVGAGAVVTKEVPANARVVGIPAKAIRVQE